MKNLLLFLLLIPVITTAQTNRVRDYSVSCGKPLNAGTTTYQINKDTCNNTYYRWVSNKWNAIESSNLNPYSGKGEKGDKGDPGVQGVQGIQGATGSQGVQGIPGVKGADGVCPPCPINNTYTAGTIYVFTNGVDDTQSIQRAIDSSNANFRPIIKVGVLKRGSGVIIDPTKNIWISGGTELAINDNAWTFYACPLPANSQDAEDRYTNAMRVFENMTIRGWNSGANQKQTGFDLMAGENNRYINIKGFNLKRFIDLTFALKTRVESCEANACIDGLIIRSGNGRYPNATNSNSCSNTCTVVDFRSYGATWTNIGLGVYDASLVKVDGLEIEGGYHNIGYDHSSIGLSSTGMDLTRVHFECALPCGIAAIRITSSTMLHIIDQPNMVKPSIMVQVVPYAGGYPNVKFRNVTNQRVFFDDVNPILKSAVGVGWMFENCDHPFVAYKMVKIFTGVTMTNSCIRENGLSRWCIINSPN